MLVLALIVAAAPPAALSSYVHVLEDGVLTMSLPVSAGPGAPTFSIIRAAAHGGVKLDGKTGVLVYTPSPDFCGPDEVRFTVTSAEGDVTVGVTHIDVVAVNDPPVAMPENLLAPRAGRMSTHLKAHDVEGSPLKFFLIDEPLRGTAHLDEKSGELVYKTDGKEQPGRDRVRYRVYDGELFSAPAVVIIDVR